MKREVRFIRLSTPNRAKLMKDENVSTSSMSLVLNFKRRSLKARRLRVIAINEYDGKYIHFVI